MTRLVPTVAAPEIVPRHAASLIILRRGAAGPEALMGLRGAGHRFMPNRLVFPGGAVDPEDGAAAAASELRPDVRRQLEIAADPVLARALAIAAARELAEETGLSLGTPPHLDGLDYLCRAVTPPDFPVRFNARFLVVEAARVGGAMADSGELEGVRWYGIAEALALDLAFVTRNVIERLLGWMDLTPAERDGRTRTPILGDRTWRLE
jgi:8-oxo-dGTP pyrophosphatase MutT (NUDIX family)